MACCLTAIYQAASHPAGTGSAASLPDRSGQVACCLTAIYQAASHPAETGSAVSLPDCSDPAACFLTAIYQAVCQPAEPHPAFCPPRHSVQLPYRPIGVFQAVSRPVVIGSVSLRSDLMKNSIPIWNLNSKHLDFGSYILRVSVEPPEFVLLPAQLVIPPSWELALPLVIAEELASRRWRLASVFRQHQRPLVLTFSHPAVN